MIKQLNKNIKGFTLMELIIVMAVIGILVMLAVPKFKEFRNRAYLTQIKNDSKVVHIITITDIHESNQIKLTKDFDDINIDNSNVFLNGDKVSFDELNEDELCLISKDDILDFTNTKLGGSFFLYNDDDIVYVDSIIECNFNNDNNNSRHMKVKDVAYNRENKFILMKNGDVYRENIDNENTFQETGIKNVSFLEIPMYPYEYNYLLAIKDDGFIYRYDINEDGVIENSTKIEVDGGDVKFREVYIYMNSETYDNSIYFAVTTDGDLYTWGKEQFGLLGHGEKDKLTINATNFEIVEKPRKVDGLSNISKFQVGFNRAIAMTKNGDIYTWGEELYPDTETLNEDYNVDIKYKPTKLNLPNKAIDFKLNFFSSIVLLENGDVYSWGDKKASNYTLGQQEDFIEKPTKINSLSGINKIIASEFAVFAITASNEIYIWGNINNISGMVGQKDELVFKEPTSINLLESNKVTDIYFGLNTIFIKDNKGNAYILKINESNNEVNFESSKIEGLNEEPSIFKIIKPFLSHYYIVTTDGHLYLYDVNNSELTNIDILKP